MTSHQASPPPARPATLHVDDDGFARAPVGLVYPRLTDVGSWGQWWPALEVTRLAGPADGGERFDLRFRARWPAVSLHVVVTPHSWQHDDRFTLTFDGDLIGEGQFWLEPGWGGTVVHHWFAGHTPRRDSLRVLAAYRRALRRGLWGFKDDVQSTVRSRAGRPA